MKTRIEYWKKYRQEIERNIQLQEAIKSSDEKLNILYNRLIQVYPKYQDDLKQSENIKNIKLEEIDFVKKYDSSKIRKIINSINLMEENNSSFNLIDDLNFSSKELDSVIKEIKKGKVKNMQYVNYDKTDDIEMTTKQIDLDTSNLKINIAIDGPSGSGKSSAAKLVAKKFGLKYINTGLVYRAIAILSLDNNIKKLDSKHLKPLLEPGIIELLENEVVYLKGVDITKRTREDLVSQIASKVAAITLVRKYALEITQDIARKKGIVMDGRDTTFRILPNAELKFYIDTKQEVRAQRRLEQNKKLGFNTSYQSILNEIKERDYRDKNREIDPLQIVEDAIFIDSSNMTLNEVVQKISDEIFKFRKD